MNSKILLINFTEKEAEKLSPLSLVIDRGFLSDVEKVTKVEVIANTYSKYKTDEEVERPVNSLDFYFPYPVYEYKAVFINLNKNESLTKEFAGRTKKFGEEDRKDFAKYWLLRGSPITIFIGDYNFSDLYDLGIPDITLKKVVNKDSAINCYETDKKDTVLAVFNEVKSEVVMPTNYYIQIKPGSSFIPEVTDHKARYLYWNNNNEDLGIFIDYNKGYSSEDRPRLFLLPQFKSNVSVAEKLLRLLGKLNPKYLPELPHSDWIDSDEYYPSDIGGYDNKIDDLIKGVTAQIKNYKEEKQKAKESYANLRGLLTQTGDELKGSVISTLRQVFKVDVEDSDVKKGGLPNEDIVINISGSKILAEVKGVKSENPSPIFIGQVWKHISQSKDKTIQRGALILNYDLETNPKERNLAYKGEHEKSLEDFIFIDTRVMFNLGLAIIDYNLLPEEAGHILFQNGRVQFNLEDYIKSKEVKKGM